MNQVLPDYTPPSFNPQARDFPGFRDEVSVFLRDRFAQYQVNFLKNLLGVSNTGTQGLATADIVAAATISPTAWMTRITGAGVITTIKAPNAFQSFIVLISMNGFSFGGGGNISNPTLIPAGTPALCIYEPKGQQWYILHL